MPFFIVNKEINHTLPRKATKPWATNHLHLQQFSSEESPIPLKETEYQDTEMSHAQDEGDCIFVLQFINHNNLRLQ